MLLWGNWQVIVLTAVIVLTIISLGLFLLGIKRLNV